MTDKVNYVRQRLAKPFASSGELDSEIIDAPELENADDASEQIQDVIEKWTLSVGDTITIREV